MPARTKVVVFDHAGEAVQEDNLGDDRTGHIRPNLKDITYVDAWRVRSLGAEIVYGHFPRGVDRAIDVAAGALVRTTPKLGAGTPVLDFADQVPRDASSLGAFASMPLWDACEDVITAWDPVEGAVRWLAANGEPVGGVPLGLGYSEIDLRATEKYVRHMARLELGPAFENAGIDFERMARQQRAIVGTQATPVSDLRCAPGGAAWLQLFDMTDDPLGRGRTWLRLDQQGPPEMITFPSTFRPFVFIGDGTALGITVEAYAQTLSRWRLTKRSTG